MLARVMINKKDAPERVVLACIKDCLAFYFSEGGVKWLSPPPHRNKNQSASQTLSKGRGLRNYPPNNFFGGGRTITQYNTSPANLHDIFTY